MDVVASVASAARDKRAMERVYALEARESVPPIVREKPVVMMAAETNVESARLAPYVTPTFSVKPTQVNAVVWTT